MNYATEIGGSEAESALVAKLFDFALVFAFAQLTTIWMLHPCDVLCKGGICNCTLSHPSAKCAEG
jgi:hypothetical protein